MKNKSEFLEENFSTATSRLKRNIIFDLAKALHRNICVRCGKEIVCPEDISIEHIQAWLYVSKELFWDMNNIGFSHKKCNVSDRQHLIHPTRINPKGKNWCAR